MVKTQLFFMSLLAIIGLFHIFQYIAKLFFYKNTCNPAIVIIVKNAQDQIEGIVRSFYGQGCNSTTEEFWIIDNGSTDETPSILKRLTIKYHDLNVIFLNETSIKTCVYEVFEHINSSIVIFVDGTRVDYKNIINLTNMISRGKTVEIGLKTYNN